MSEKMESLGYKKSYLIFISPKANKQMTSEKSLLC